MAAIVNMFSEGGVTADSVQRFHLINVLCVELLCRTVCGNPSYFCKLSPVSIQEREPQSPTDRDGNNKIIFISGFLNKSFSPILCKSCKM